MKAISIEVDFDTLIIGKVNVRKNVNTNNFVDGKAYFSFSYLNLCRNRIKKFLNSLNIYNVVFLDYVSFCYIFPIGDFINVKFNVNESLNFKVMDLLLKSKNLKSVDCYFMPSDYVSKFSERNVKLKFNKDISFGKSFSSDNKVSELKDLYYRNVVSFYSEKEVIDNLEEFLRINNSLKVINLYYFSREIIDYVILKLNEYNENEVDVYIYQDESNKYAISNSLSYLKKINKKYKDKSGREIKIIYTDEYVSDNFFKELTINGIKFAMVLVLYVGVVFMFSNEYHEYVALLNLRVLESTLAYNEEEIEVDEIDDTDITPEEPVVEVPSTPEVVEPTPSTPVYVNRYANIPTTFDKLLSINTDVVGWVNVNNTNVNYPVTQSTDNNFYLEHDIYKKKITTGWIFMDYRNNSVELDHNTIIYGHNLKTGYMFGSLQNTAKREWYTDSANQIITFNTLSKTMTWKIFSIYKVDYTDDYLKTSFYNEEQFLNFVSMIKSRSIYDFGVEVLGNDKILTLSTCTGNNRRLAIHAVLVSEY